MRAAEISLSNVDASEWNALVGADDPFNEHGFLAALIKSQSVGGDSGWQARFRAVRDQNGELLAVLPLYMKSHSFGEYTFDFEWARYAARRGIRYYPKLLGMTPFTPASGARILSARPQEEFADLFLAQVEAERANASSIHLLYLSEAEQETWCERGLFARSNLQFHWTNAGYGSFEDFLGALRSENRKQIRRERRVREQHRIVRKLGHELTSAEWEFIATAYQLGCLEHGSEPYLTTDFWQDLRPWASNHESPRVLAVLAYEDESPVAMSVAFFKGERLYGRYWGTTVQTQFLHFECCYYQLIEFAIEKKIRIVEAGAQGIHKLKRGFLPIAVRSAHRIFEPTFHAAAELASKDESNAIQEQIDELDEHAPYAQRSRTDR